jgi:hypothetical protein
MMQNNMRDMSDVEKHAFFDYMGFDKQERHEFFERLGIKHPKGKTLCSELFTYVKFYEKVLPSVASATLIIMK